MSDLSVVKHDSFDTMIAEDIFTQATELQSIIVQGQEKLKTFSDLSKDVFYSMYKSSPEIVVNSNPLSKLNHDEMKKFMENPLYQELRQYTMLDNFASALGTKTLLDEFLDRIENDSELQNIVNYINAMGEDNNGDGLETLLESASGSLRRAINQAGQKALQEAEENDSLMSGWGIGQGSLQQIPFTERAALLEHIKKSSSLSNISALLGRIKAVASASRKSKLDHARVELHSITLGDNINNLLPSESVLLARPQTKTLFYKKFIEKQLLQYDLKINDNAGKGEIICLIDGSGSMNQHLNGNTRDGWAKATALGLLSIAQKEKRHFAYAIFGDSEDDLITGQFEFGKVSSPIDLVNFAEAFYGGGTDFQKPMEWSVNKLKDSKFTKADIVMITDGDCGMSGEFIETLKKVKAEKKFTANMILLGTTEKYMRRAYDMSWVDNCWDNLDVNSVESLYKKI